MGSTDLALSWKDHHGVLFNVFEKLLAKKSLVDCTLAAEGKFLKAHRIVLSACSPYFEALLDQEHDKHPIIFLRDVQFEDLKTLLEFVYSGEIKIPENRLVEFLNVAEALQIKGLGGVGNEGQVNKSSTDVLPQRETRSPVPRKRTRRHSSSSDGSSRDRAEIIPVSSESSRPKSNSEKIVPVANNASTSEPVPRQTSVVPSEDLNPNVKVKEEIITPVQSTCSDLLSSDQSADNEEILGLKPEFEQVTFTEDYSDDMLPEDSDSVDHVIDQDQPSSSQQYSGFSAESAKAGELSIHPPFAVGGVNQPVPEDISDEDRTYHPPDKGSSSDSTDYLCRKLEVPENYAEMSRNSDLQAGHSRKRPRRINEWKKRDAQMKRNRGDEYIDRTGKIHVAREPQDLTNHNVKCRYGCQKNIAEDQRKYICEYFWKLGDYNLQTSFLYNAVTVLDSVRNRGEGNRNRNISTKLHLGGYRVCKYFFTKTLGISYKRIDIVVMKKKNARGTVFFSSEDMKDETKPGTIIFQAKRKQPHVLQFIIFNY